MVRRAGLTSLQGSSAHQVLIPYVLRAVVFRADRLAIWLLGGCSRQLDGRLWAVLCPAVCQLHVLLLLCWLVCACRRRAQSLCLGRCEGSGLHLVHIAVASCHQPGQGKANSSRSWSCLRQTGTQAEVAWQMRAREPRIGLRCPCLLIWLLSLSRCWLRSGLGSGLLLPVGTVSQAPKGHNLSEQSSDGPPGSCRWS